MLTYLSNIPDCFHVPGHAMESQSPKDTQKPCFARLTETAAFVVGFG